MHTNCCIKRWSNINSRISQYGCSQTFSFHGESICVSSGEHPMTSLLVTKIIGIGSVGKIVIHVIPSWRPFIDILWCHVCLSLTFFINKELYEQMINSDDRDDDTATVHWNETTYTGWSRESRLSWNYFPLQTNTIWNTDKYFLYHASLFGIL